jgi:hypothetical protein
VASDAYLQLLMAISCLYSLCHIGQIVYRTACITEEQAECLRHLIHHVDAAEPTKSCQRLLNVKFPTNTHLIKHRLSTRSEQASLRHGELPSMNRSKIEAAFPLVCSIHALVRYTVNSTERT